MMNGAGLATKADWALDGAWGGGARPRDLPRLIESEPMAFTAASVYELLSGWK